MPINELKNSDEIVQYMSPTGKYTYTVLFTFQLCNGSRELRHQHRQQREQ
jgi:hypothetical protein